MPIPEYLDSEIRDRFVIEHRATGSPCWPFLSIRSIAAAAAVAMGDVDAVVVVPAAAAENWMTGCCCRCSLSPRSRL